jgi:hypothetical protein
MPTEGTDHPLRFPVSAAWTTVILGIALVAWSSLRAIDGVNQSIAEIQADVRRNSESAAASTVKDGESERDRTWIHDQLLQQTTKLGELAIEVQEAKKEAEGVSAEKEGQFNTVEGQINSDKDNEYHVLCLLYVKSFSGACPFVPSFWPGFRK